MVENFGSDPVPAFSFFQKFSSEHYTKRLVFLRKARGTKIFSPTGVYFGFCRDLPVKGKNNFRKSLNFRLSRGLPVRAVIAEAENHNALHK